jgi:hypothetical protein
MTIIEFEQVPFSHRIMTFNLVYPYLIFIISQSLPLSFQTMTFNVQITFSMLAAFPPQ